MIIKNKTNVIGVISKIKFLNCYSNYKRIRYNSLYLNKNVEKFYKMEKLFCIIILLLTITFTVQKSSEFGKGARGGVVGFITAPFGGEVGSVPVSQIKPPSPGGR
jgi:hypothetical protein